MTTREAMQALLDGKKLTTEVLMRDYISMSDDGYIYNSDGVLYELKGTLESYVIYEEPKPTKQVWQWRYFYGDLQKKVWIVDPELLSEGEVLLRYEGYKREKHAGPFEVEYE